jgi:hypothetical protein
VTLRNYPLAHLDAVVRRLVTGHPPAHDDGGVFVRRILLDEVAGIEKPALEGVVADVAGSAPVVTMPHASQDSGSKGPGSRP